MPYHDVEQLTVSDRVDSGRMPPAARAALVLGLIYVFLVGVSSLESGIKLLGADVQETLFSTVRNPLAGLFVGILGTVLVQSSSASTSVIVGLVASGVLGFEFAVPMVMGANIGTTVTNTLVSLAHLRRSAEFMRAFAAAVVHDFFNVVIVLVLLPLELLTGAISGLAERISEPLVGAAGTEWKSPIKGLVKQPVGWLEDLWSGFGANGDALGTLLVVCGVATVLLALAFVTKNMRRLVAQRVESSLNMALSKGSGMVALLVGLVITISVQSSSITTSMLIPLSAAGVLTLRNAYPVTLGAKCRHHHNGIAGCTGDQQTRGAHHSSGPHAVQHRRESCCSTRSPPFGRSPSAEPRSWPAWQSIGAWLAVAYVAGMFIAVPFIGVALLS